MSPGHPRHCDVVVVGGGLSGLICARALSLGGAQVVVADESGGARESAQELDLGVAAFGFPDSPARLCDGLGEATARALHAFSVRSLTALEALCTSLDVPIRARGSWRVALDATEASEWRESLTLLRRWRLGGEVTLEQASALGVRESGDHGIAISVQADLTVDLPALRAALLRELVSLRVSRISGRVRVEERAGVVQVLGLPAPLTAEAAVVAAGGGAGAVHPFFSARVIPVRLHATDVEAPPPPLPLLFRHRFEAVGAAGGRLRIVGCRWADGPELGAGVRESIPHPNVVTAQRAFLARHLGVSAAQVGTTQVGFVAAPCDGLPLLGPLPGAPRIVSLVGCSGWGLSLLPAAALDVAAGLLGRPVVAPTPALCLARRML